MSALLIDELFVPLAPRPQADGWRHVEREQQAQRPHLVAVPPATAGPSVVPARPRVAHEAAPLRLTDRGIAVILGFFLALLATAAVVLVVGFLNVSNEPNPATGQLTALVVTPH